MTYHAMIQGPQAALDGLYALHQFVARAMRNDPRDYLYAYDAAGNMIYLRTQNVDRKRLRDDVKVLQDWTPLSRLTEGQTYTVTGRLYIDQSPSRYRNAIKPLAPRGMGYSLEDSVTYAVGKKLAAFATVQSLDIQIDEAIPLNKPAMSYVSMAPVLVRAVLTLRDAGLAERVQAQGVGRGRAFGFGVLHFTPTTDQEVS